MDELAAAERATCRAVLALSATIGTGVCETVGGLPPGLLLANLCRLISSDRSTILTAADVLRSMPVVAGLWADEQLSWGQVRNICMKASNVRIADRQVLDRRVAASAGEVDAYGPDGLLDAVDRAILELRELDDVQRQQTVEQAADFLSMQGRLDGGMKVYGEFTGVDAAVVANGVHDAAPPVTPGTTLAERLAIGLKRICADHLAGGPGRRAKPLVNVLVDLAQVTTTAAGTVDLHVNAPLERLTARTVETLSQDADRRRERPSESASLQPETRPPPPPHELGGDHDPDNLVMLRSRWHQLLHGRAWSNRLDPTTGVFTIERDGRTYRCLPKGTPLRGEPRPAAGPDPPGDPPTDPFGDPLPC